MPVSQLPRDEVARRIRAGRELRKVSQTALATLMVADGLNKHDLGQIERERRTMQLAHQESILRHLRLPERWLTADSVDDLVGGTPSPISANVEELADRLRGLAGEIDQVLNRLGRDIGKRDVQRRRGQGPSDPPRQDAA